MSFVFYSFYIKRDGQLLSSISIVYLFCVKKAFLRFFFKLNCLGYTNKHHLVQEEFFNSNEEDLQDEGLFSLPLSTFNAMHTL